MKAKRVLVEVSRDPMDKPVIEVFEHEVACLEAQHGEAAIRVLTEIPDGYDKKRLNSVVLNTNEEYSRLMNCYGLHKDFNMPVAEYVFRGPRGLNDFSLDTYMSDKASGFDDDLDATDGDPDDNEGGDEMGMDDVKAVLKEIGVAYHPNLGLPKLTLLLNDEVRIQLDELDIDYNVAAPIEELIGLLRDQQSEGGE